MRMQHYNQSLFSLCNILILINIGAYFVADILDPSKLYFGLNSYFLEKNLWHQPLSSMFMHENTMHIFMNMFILFQFGNMIENAKGKLFFFNLYIIGGIATSLATFVFINQFAPTHNVIGASGAISLMLGYLAFVDKFNRNGIVIWILLISFAPLLIGENVAWYAHTIGFLFGFILGSILPSSKRR